MSTNFERLFEDLVARYYKPIALQVGLSLERLGDGVYEIAGRAFAMRIRRGTGHFPSFLITIRETMGAPQDLNDLRGEIGLGVIAAFNEVSMPKGEARLQDLEAIFAQTSKVAEKLGLPYVLGKKDDISDIREFIENKILQKGIREKKYTFPKNIREEWI